MKYIYFDFREQLFCSIVLADFNEDLSSLDKNLKKIKLVSNKLKNKFLILFDDEGEFNGESFAFEVNTVLIKGK